MPCSYVCLTVRTLPTARPATGLVGFGLFIAAQSQGRWRFRQAACAISIDQRPTSLLGRMAANLPRTGCLISWDEPVVASRLRAVAARAPAAMSRRFMRRYGNLRRHVIDLHPVGSLPPSSFAAAAVDQAIYAPIVDPVALRTSWASGNVRQVRRDLADEATALWWMFLNSAGHSGLAAEEATHDWIALRQTAVGDAGRG